MERRRFIQSAAVTFSTALTAANARRVMGANDRIMLGGIGVGGRGQQLLKDFLKWNEIDIAVLCDANEKRDGVGQLAELIDTMRGHAPKREYDLRKVLENDEVDAVVIATCDHWHAPAAVWACQHGKDVYVEKPPSHNIWEGRKMVEAARKYNRVVQCGTQNRSAPYNRKALEYIQSGALGEIHLCKVFNLKDGGPFTMGPDGQPPAGFHYDLWLGPAAQRPYNSDMVQNWKVFWDFTADDLADDGVHQLDLARMLTGDKVPGAVHSSGGHLAFQDDRETPDTLVTTYEFDDFIMTFELSQWASYMKKTSYDIRNGDKFPQWPQSATRIELYGTKGRMMMGRHGGGWQAFGPDMQVIAQEYGRFPDDPHKQNFIDCLKSRERPNADVEIGHLSACLIHLASVSYRVGGHKLKYDANAERFLNDDDANALVKRHYREPYVIPENV